MENSKSPYIFLLYFTYFTIDHTLTTAMNSSLPVSDRSPSVRPNRQPCRYGDQNGELCAKCNWYEPPKPLLNNVKILFWIACEHPKCGKWYHKLCLNLPNKITGTWHCPRCPIPSHILPQTTILPAVKAANDKKEEDGIVRTLEAFLCDDEDLIGKFKCLISDVGVGKDKANMFVKGATKYLIGDNYIEQKHPRPIQVAYASIIPYPPKSTGTLYLDWLCHLGNDGVILNGDLMASKPDYPGAVEPQQRRLPIAPEWRPAISTLLPRPSTDRERWMNHLDNSIARVYKMMKAEYPERTEEDIVGQIYDEWRSNGKIE